MSQVPAPVTNDSTFIIDLICTSSHDDTETTLDILFPKHLTSDDKRATKTLAEFGYAGGSTNEQ